MVVSIGLSIVIDVTLCRFCLEIFLTRFFINVVLPHPGGPITTTTTGGLSRPVRFMMVTTSFLCARSQLRWISFLARPTLDTPNAYVRGWSHSQDYYNRDNVYSYPSVTHKDQTSCLRGARPHTRLEIVLILLFWLSGSCFLFLPKPQV